MFEKVIESGEIFWIEAFSELPSTQDEVKKRIQNKSIRNRLVIRAEVQTKGRGRFGREWQSTRGGSYQSIAIQDLEGMYQKQALSSAIAVGLAQSFSFNELQLGIKWPNDLYLRSKKVAGILPEFYRGYLILGIGVNALNDVPETGMQLGVEATIIHAMVLRGVVRGLELSQHPLTESYAPFDLLNKQPITLKDNDKLTSGIASGVNANGCLQILVDDELKTCCTGTLSEFKLREL